ncbi:MAG TPA: anthranilate synthase component I [Acidimicrobiia bacterium]
MPDRDTFFALAREHTVVPVWREVLADMDTPLSAFAKLVGDRDGFLLESVEHAERWGRYSFLGWDPVATLTVRGTEVAVDGEALTDVPRDRGALGVLEAMVAQYRAPTLEALPPFHGGMVGYLGYDVVREIERIGSPPADDLGFADAVVFLTASVAAFDHYAQRVHLIENVYVDPGTSDADLAREYERACDRLDHSAEVLAASLPATTPVAPPAASEGVAAFTRRTSFDEYARSVEAAKEYILAGDIFQVVLAQRFDLDEPCDPFGLYRVLRVVNPSPYMYFMRAGTASVVGSSPEALVRVQDGRVISRPIAGTRKRGRDVAHDRRLEAELTEHPKERAEHVMLLDLARNDVGRVVQFGTEQVDEMMTLERYSHVMHMTSQVSGDLAEGRDAIDVLRATFPAGTVSGAPKVRAMQIIDELEPAKRGPYAGVVGYVDFSGNLDTAIAIRTMVFDGTRASVSAGAGIVADSNPADEDLECNNKARALLNAAAAAQSLFPVDGDTT